MNFWESFRISLRDARKLAGYTQADMAVRLEISRPTYTYYETGKTHPDFHTIIRIAEILEIPLEFFAYPRKKRDNLL